MRSRSLGPIKAGYVCRIDEPAPLTALRKEDIISPGPNSSLILINDEEGARLVRSMEESNLGHVTIIINLRRIIERIRRLMVSA